jgi:hypothetical protein
MKKLNITREEFITLWPEGLKIAEIGVFKGVHSKELLKSKPSQLTLIDIWRHIADDGVYSTLDACNLTDRGHVRIWNKVKKAFAENPEVEVIREFGDVHAQTVENEHYDVVYIDGDHSYEGCLRDMEAWKTKVAKGGFMYGHDYTDSFAWIEVIKSVTQFLQDNPDWHLVAITGERPRKSPSWIIARKESFVWDLLTLSPENKN